MEFLYEIGLFIVKSFWFVICVIVVLIAFSSIIAKRRGPSGDRDEGHLVIKHLNELHRELQRTVDMEAFDPKSAQRARKLDQKQRKEMAKERDREAKAATKTPRKAETEAGEAEVTDKKERQHIFVINFDGEDVDAARVEYLRKEINALLVRTKKPNEVVVRLKSGGGYVHSYGFAASQLLRVREAGIKLTVAVDQIAASGGYMMAAVADKIIAAPFAVIGSIGVAAEMPNLHRLLKKHDIDYEILTAGKHKRTLTMFGENTDEHREKFQEEMEEVHILFQDFISKYRDRVDVPSTATGESWYGTKALELNLIDAISTSDQYILTAANDSEIYELEWVTHDRPLNKLAERLAASAAVVSNWLKMGLNSAQGRSQDRLF